MPALLLALSTSKDRSTMWVQKHRPRPVTVDGQAYNLVYSDKTEPLGFAVTLNRFHLGTYPGTGRPRTFESHVALADSSGNAEQQAVVSMNRPLQRGGYSLFQSSYDMSGGRRVSYLSVSRDPGLPIAFTGYGMMVGGMLIVLGTRMVDRRKATRAELRIEHEGLRRRARAPEENEFVGSAARA